MKKTILVSAEHGETRVAVLESKQKGGKGNVAELYIERRGRRSIVGNIYKGKVDNVLPGMEAAFVDIGLERNGFLHVDEIVMPDGQQAPKRGRGSGRRINELIKPGQEILVQVVKDPLKSKGARLSMNVSIAGRYLVYAPTGSGVGVSRRLSDKERDRLRKMVDRTYNGPGGLIVRTAAHGAKKQDFVREIAYLQKLNEVLERRSESTRAPALVFQEADLSVRVLRDVFLSEFETAIIDSEKQFERVTSFFQRTAPELVGGVELYKGPKPLFEKWHIDDEIESTLNRRIDLPSGGYLIIDYTEALTVIDVNSGSFTGRGKGGLEETITKVNTEAADEAVRQLRLRDIGGIIVIDFIDMANPKNRGTVEEALRTELERDRTKTYVVEISPLGLVEMTRQNVTDGPREVMTRKCPTCGGDGIVYSEASAAIDVERRLRALAVGSRAQAFRVELADGIASALVGPGARRLIELEALTKKRFFLEGKPETHLDHFVVLSEGKLADLAPPAPVGEDAEVMLQLVEVDRYDGAAAVGKLEGLDVVVADAASLVGKRIKVRVERVLDGRAYAVAIRKAKAEPEPLTAEGEAEKPTRKPPARKGATVAKESEPAAEESTVEAEEPEAETASEDTPEAEDTQEAEQVSPPTPTPAAKKKTRRGSRGGRKRKKTPAATAEATDAGGATEESSEPSRGVTIHIPGDDLGRDGKAEPVEEAPAAPGPESTEEPTTAEAAEEAEADAAETESESSIKSWRTFRRHDFW